jgi:hypothetical protein
MDIERLLDEARGGQANTENDMTDQQQADQLRESMAAYVNPVKFRVGDLVRYRSECKGYIRNHSRLHIIMELIDPPHTIPLCDSSIGSNVASRKYDVVIGVTDAKEKGCVLKYVADSRELEPYPEAERLTRQHS